MVKNVEKLLIVLVLLGQLWAQGYNLPFFPSTPAYLLALIGLSMLVCIRAVLEKGGGLSFTGMSAIAVLMVGNILFVFLVTDSFNAGRFILIICSFLFMASCSQCIEEEKDINFFLYCYLAIVFVSSLFVIGQYYEIPICTEIWEKLHPDINISKFDRNKLEAATEGSRYLGLASDALQMGYHASTAFIITLFSRFNGKKLIKFALLVVFVYALYLNETRSSWIAALAGLFFFVVKKPKGEMSQMKAFMRLFAQMGLVFALLVVLMNEINLFAGTRFMQMDAGTSARIPMILTAFNHALHHPFGMGVYSVEPSLAIGATAAEKVYVIKNTAHNLLGNCVASYGFIGLFLMLWFYIRAYKDYKTIWKSNLDDRPYFTALACLVGLFINAFFHNSYMLNGELSSFLMFGVLVAGIALVEKNGREE
ncbi:MAG: O-antigen ligase family protein [Clostridia bacterium]|nr:O-antigen ligase family protein [Clostridia bacterium]